MHWKGLIQSVMRFGLTNNGASALYGKKAITLMTFILKIIIKI